MAEEEADDGEHSLSNSCEALRLMTSPSGNLEGSGLISGISAIAKSAYKSCFLHQTHLIESFSAHLLVPHEWIAVWRDQGQ